MKTSAASKNWNRLHREIAEDILWNMVDKDEDQRQSAKEVETKIA